MDMCYLAEHSYQLIYFGTILNPLSELPICHKTRSPSTTAVRRLLEDGGTPHPSRLRVSQSSDEDGFFHSSLLPIWFLCWKSHTLPVDHVVLTGHVVCQRQLVDLIALVYFTPFGCFKSFLCSFCLLSILLPVSPIYSIRQSLHGTE